MKKVICDWQACEEEGRSVGIPIRGPHHEDSGVWGMKEVDLCPGHLARLFMFASTDLIPDKYRDRFLSGLADYLHPFLKKGAL